MPWTNRNTAVHRTRAIGDEPESAVPPAPSPRWRPITAAATALSILSGVAHAWPTIEVTSSSLDVTTAIEGSIVSQISTINGGPPVDPTWIDVLSKNDNTDDSFECDQVADPLLRPFVSALTYLSDADEITLDNCRSAWFRITFDLATTDGAVMTAIANCDDFAVAYLNGQRVTASLLQADIDNLQANMTEALDRTDAQGRPLLSWPTLDTFTVSDASLFVAGENELILGLMGDASFSPSGLELSATVTLPSCATATFTEDTTIGAGNDLYDGLTLVVDGCALTMDGSHSVCALDVINGGVVTHSPGSMLELQVVGDASIDFLSSIDVTGKGDAALSGTAPGLPGLNSGGGGGHGGAGGRGQNDTGNPGGTYGSIFMPATLGSGGAPPFGGGLGGAGGGGIHLTVGGELTVNGTIRANGQNGPNCSSGGGAGGSIWLELTTLAGVGLVTANGGAGNTCNSDGGGGGGGRIAVYYVESSFIGFYQALGGSSTSARRGGAGTMYVKDLEGPLGTVTIDNGGISGATTEMSEFVDLDADLLVKGRAIVGPAPGDPLHLAVQGDMMIENFSLLSANGRGFTSGMGPGSGEPGLNSGSGGGHGGASGIGQNATGAAGGTYGSIFAPTTFGSGGAPRISGGSAGAGGGSIRLEVTGTLTVEGTISADGANGPNCSSGGGAGGSLWITCGVLDGFGLISTSGGVGNSCDSDGGSGGGGRIAVYFDDVSFGGAYRAVGGNGGASVWRGGAGTVLVSDLQNPRGVLTIDNGGISGGVTELGGTIELDADVVITNTAILGPPKQVALDLTILGDLDVQNSGFINGDGRGYAASNGPGAGLPAAPSGGGGGHGGAGATGQNGGLGGVEYGSLSNPTDFGSGGAGPLGGGLGGAGGGAIRLNVMGTFLNNGQVSSDGANGPSCSSGGGSGGSLWIETSQLSGLGLITANGGAGNTCFSDGGGGAGGRILICADLLDFNLDNAFVAPGTGGSGSEIGSIFLCQACPGDTNGDGKVDIDDVINVVLDFGTDGTVNGGDADGSGLVDIDDVVFVVLNFGVCPEQ